MSDGIDLQNRKLKAGILTFTLLLTGTVAISPFVIDEIFIQEEKFGLNASANITAPNSTNLGVNSDGGGTLAFPRMSTEMNATREINVSGIEGEPALVRLSSEGNISDYLHYKKVHYFNGSKQVGIEMVPNGTGYFEGAVNVNVEVPKEEGGAKWLELKSQLY